MYKLNFKYYFKRKNINIIKFINLNYIIILKQF